MFYYLTGKLVHVGDGVAVLDVGGVGYKLTVSSTTLGSLPSTSGEPTVRLYTHFSVREDAVELYGFYTLDELDTFRLLTAISGVGPKAAMSILSQLSPSALADAVAASAAYIRKLVAYGDLFAVFDKIIHRSRFAGQNDALAAHHICAERQRFGEFIEVRGLRLHVGDEALHHMISDIDRDADRDYRHDEIY